MWIVENGHCEVYTEFEGNEFILERLYQGSVINYKTFFMDDLMTVNIRCGSYVNILELTAESFQLIQTNHVTLEKKINMYQH